MPALNISVPSGYCPNSGFSGGFAVVRVTNSKLDAAAIQKDPATCDKDTYTGKTDTCWDNTCQPLVVSRDINIPTASEAAP